MNFRPRIALITALIVLISSLAVGTASAVSLTADEQYMLNLVNKERRANGLNALEVDPKLTFMARRYGQEMITHDFFSHDSPVSGSLLDRVLKSGVSDGWLLAGENLAGAPSVEAAFKGLMESPTHKANMLEAKYTHVGIGAVVGGPYGKMFAQEFIAYPKNMFFVSRDPNYDLLVYINDKLLCADPPSFIRQGRTLVPIRKFFEELGAAVVWDSASNLITIDHNGVNIQLAVGDNVAFVNGEPVILDIMPSMKASATFVPLRFVAECLGAQVSWNTNLRTVTVQLPISSDNP
ncbi:MAG: hypothetical protein A2074_04225 [Candidatus Aquicultor primus]|uniref:CAP domain-containing protein n=1 Tax=Candidatus Aquicultor primus TaxID=1797195 RepID=A0A1F2UN09_9ACTN|nr:MAG: hypothetical protein A2074_04225 [Candidatus Aquicultor primus]